MTVYRGTDDSIPYYCMWLGITGQAWATVQVAVKGTSKNPIFRGAALRLACLPHLVTYGVTLKNYRLHINHMQR